jgi:hypothetical protein
MVRFYHLSSIYYYELKRQTIDTYVVELICLSHRTYILACLIENILILELQDPYRFEHVMLLALLGRIDQGV